MVFRVSVKAAQWHIRRQGRVAVVDDRIPYGSICERAMNEYDEWFYLIFFSLRLRSLSRKCLQQ
jgi:hypothetical protein